MSGIVDAVKSVFKGVASIVKKVWKPLAVAAAVYFTAGALSPMLAGGAAAADVGAAGAAAADGGIGLAADSLVPDAFAIAPAADAAAGITADASAAGGLASGAAAAGDASAGLMGSGIDAAGGLADAGGTALSSATMDPVTFGINPATTQGAGMDFTEMNAVAPASGSNGLISDSWNKAMDAAGWMDKHPTMAMGLLQGAGGVLKGIQQADMMNQQYKWAAAHAPYQTSGSVGNPYSGFQYNSLLSKQNPQNYQGQMPVQNMRMNPYKPTGMVVPAPQQQQQAAFSPLNPVQQQEMMTSGLMGQNVGMPFVEGPQDESILGGYV